jgi:protein O-mannosyl-transferase
LTSQTPIHPARGPLLLKALLIIAAGFWVFSPAFHGGWLWDDDRLIINNLQLRSPGGLWKIWFEPGRQADYYPVEQTALWMEWQLWHYNTLGYHLVNVLLHVLSALLVWRLLDKLGLRLAWLGGLFFALHPVQVESVAWIAELKNTLSMPPFLLAMCAWIDYDRLGKRKDYFLALGLFLVAMLCKITVVMFPVVILLFAWWRHNRIGWFDLKLSAPFFLVSLAVGLVTILCGLWDRHFNHLGPEYAPPGGVVARLILAGSEIAFYFSKSVLPVGLLPIYPKWAVDPSSPMQYLPWVILTGVIGWFWVKRLSWGRHVLFGLGFFLVNLTPCPGFIPAPDMGYAWVMDHFLYLPIIGLIGILVAACGQMDEGLSPSFRPLGIGAMGIVLALLAAESHGYAGIFINQEKLWTYTLQGNPDSDVAHNNLGLVYLNSGRIPQAIDQFETALRIKPDYAFAHNGLGNALFLSGRAAEAINHYHEALKIDPGYPEAHNGLANALLQSGHLPEARAESEQSLKFNPNYADAHCTLGLVMDQQGEIPEAIEQFETALRLNPTDARIEQVLEALRSAQQNTVEKK